MQFREYYRLRKLQILSSFNERLSKCSKANKWISTPEKPWDQLESDEKYEFQNYIAVFEDIGLARKVGIIGKYDFLKSYGGRYKKFVSSGALEKFISTEGYSKSNFERLNILNKEIFI